MTQEQSSSAPTVFGFAKNLAEASIVLATGLFILGYSYLYGYYRAFGLSPDDLNLSVNTVLVHSIPVIRNTVFVITSICVLLAIGTFRKSARILDKPAFVLLLLFVVGLAASWYGSWVGRGNALRDTHLSTSTLPYVTFDGDEDAEQGMCNFAESNYRLLGRTNEWAYVVIPVDDNQDIAATNIRVCSFSNAHIHAMRLQVGLEGK